MGHLNTLALTALKARAPKTISEQRRAKLCHQLEEQLAMASAAADGRPYTAMKTVWRKEPDGSRVRVERPKRVKAWWWQDGAAISMVVRYGARPLELAKGGKRAISVPDMAALLKAITTVIAAAQDGELDDAITTVVSGSKAKPAKG
jgi:hypothetical protein